jgi:hypothetical protein
VVSDFGQHNRMASERIGATNTGVTRGCVRRSDRVFVVLLHLTKSALTMVPAIAGFRFSGGRHIRRNW